ncbi:REP-associated tyrosine transposase [Virgibacillus flavescens]|uniref:REP-associated tyrosine transposase n=1 Tax=Virgibacillus flavescens TaxID=1611422 RepID=UPI003D34B510
MPRKPRIWVPNSFYHITCRGNRKEALFKEEADYRTFLTILRQLHERAPFEIASYCLMSNHYHLQLRSKDHNLAKLMWYMNKKFATYFNAKYNLSGHVFENRYFGEVINDRAGMLAVSRYIHRNPVDAEMVKLAEDYPWSSYHFYKNNERNVPPYMNTEIILDLFSGGDGNRSIYYHGFVQTPLPRRTPKIT